MKISPYDLDAIFRAKQHLHNSDWSDNYNPKDKKMSRLGDFQKFTASTNQWPEEKKTLAVCVELAAECGELINRVKKLERKNKLPDAAEKLGIMDEAGDVLWGVSEILNRYGLTFEDCLYLVEQKLKQRMTNNTIINDEARNEK